MLNNQTKFFKNSFYRKTCPSLDLHDKFRKFCFRSCPKGWGLHDKFRKFCFRSFPKGWAIWPFSANNSASVCEWYRDWCHKVSPAGVTGRPQPGRHGYFLTKLTHQNHALCLSARALCFVLWQHTAREQGLWQKFIRCASNSKPPRDLLLFYAANHIIMYLILRVLEAIRTGHWREWVWAVSYRKVFVGSRLCALKMMLHLSKNRDVSVALCGRRSSLWCWWILPIRIVCGRSYKFGSSSGECWAFSL